MVVEGFMRMVRDVSSVAHQALASGGGGGVVAYNAALGNTWGPSGASLNASATGTNNVALGANAMMNTTTGNAHTAIGYSALKENTTGIRNVGVGTTALRQNEGGSFNTAVGYGANINLVDSSCNVAVGYSSLAGKVGSRASQNVAVGYEALKDVSGGTYNVAVGSYAFAGAGAPYTPESLDGSYNVAIGARAGEGVAGAASGHYSHNTWVGGMAAYVPWGADPGQTDSVSNSVAVGFEALYRARGNGSVAVGYKAMKGDLNYGGPFGSSYSTAVGYEALRDVSGASGAVAIGNKALRAGGQPQYAGAGTNTNVAVGQKAMELLGQDGSGGNVALGGCALCASVSGGWNTALGNGALSDNTDGNNNVGVGCSALASLISGSNNTALGHYAGLGMSNNNFDGLLILNATGEWFPTGLSADVSNSFFVKPVREASQTNALYYNPTSGEVTHSGAGSAFSSGGYGSKWITATDASNNGWNAHPYGGSGLGTSPVSLGTLTGLHESDILAAFASGTHAMRARITIYGAGGGGGGGTSGSTGNGRNGQGGGSGAMYTFINYDVSATLWDNSAGLLGLAGGGSPGAAPGQFEGAYGTGGGAGGGPPPVLITGGNTPAAGSASNPIGYVPTFYDALWSSYYTPTYPHGFGIGGGGGGMGGVSTGTTAGGGTGGVIQGPGSVTALTPHLGNWRVPSVTFPALPGNVNSPGAVGAGTTSYGPSYVAQPGAAAGLLLTNSPFLSKNAWGTDGGVEGKGNQGPYGAGGALAWSFPALPGGDAKYSAGGGGGGASFQWSTEAGKRGGKGGDALMIIEWWL